MNEAMNGMLAILKFQQSQKIMEAMVGMAMQPQADAAKAAEEERKLKAQAEINKQINDRAAMMKQEDPSKNWTDIFKEAEDSILRRNAQAALLPAA